MGGHNSGRYRTRNRGACEHALGLDIRRLRRDRQLRDGEAVVTTVIWRWTDRREAGSIRARLDLATPENRHAELAFSHGGEPRRQRVEIAARPMRYGGFRFYFVCPVTRRPCEVIYCVNGSFQSRRASRLAYASQSENSFDRLLRRKAKVEARLWPKDGRRRKRGKAAADLRHEWAQLEAQADGIMDDYLCLMAEKILKLGRRL